MTAKPIKNLLGEAPADVSSKFNSTWRRWIAIAILLGVFFRFYNLERKVYWYDETMTSLRVSGHTQTELVEQVFDGRPLSVNNLLQRYQYPNPKKDINDTLDALAGNPEHSPLYYLLARWWLQRFGNSVATLRVLSAIISLFAFPCIYWLCSELFGLPAVSWGAVAIIAISPFHVLYAQEAREYSLWTVAILFSCAALLRALRQRMLSWGTYSISVALCLYAHPFSGFVLVGHGIAVLVREGFCLSNRLRAYLLSSIGGLLLFVPWLLIVVNHFHLFLENTDSVNHTRSGFLPLFWGLNLSRIFFDLNQGTSPFSPLHYLSAFLAGYALYYLYRHAPPNAWVFIVTLVGVTGMALIVPDVVLGGRRSTITRYAIPCYLGIQIAVAYLLATKLGTQLWFNRRWRYVAIALIFSGVLSCAISSQIPVWWHKSYAKSRYNPQIARTINSSQPSLVITDEIPGRVLSLAHLLKPQVQLQLVTDSQGLAINGEFENIYLYRPSESLLEELSDYSFEEIQPWLWKR